MAVARLAVICKNEIIPLSQKRKSFRNKKFTKIGDKKEFVRPAWDGGMTKKRPGMEPPAFSAGGPFFHCLNRRLAREFH
ncbi:hypothetical protein NXS98_04875 [Fontisphaera persica]|uniref:hypothetical protein n=1 Tax=Fontisphaera persica TaxID=2974023 RepID=UPI0024C06C89|nr:hypothetical protein [Fontisphaera persica]WCJ60468.1 hypothetical protein NXS98_04875 [Fontisphaera persica]